MASSPLHELHLIFPCPMEQPKEPAYELHASFDPEQVPRSSTSLQHMLCMNFGDETSYFHH
jgi:hypothetical protein